MCNACIMRTYLGAKLFNQLCMHSCTVALHTHTTYITPHAHTMHVYAHMHIYRTHTHTHRHAGSHTLTHVYPFMGTTFVYMYTHTHTHTHTHAHHMPSCWFTTRTRHLIESGAVGADVVVDKECPSLALARVCEDGLYEFADVLLNHGAKVGWAP